MTFLGCRHQAVVIVVYVASTLMALVFLTYTIEVTLHENREDAADMAEPGRTSELIRVRFHCCYSCIAVLAE